MVALQLLDRRIKGALFFLLIPSLSLAAPGDKVHPKAVLRNPAPAKIKSPSQKVSRPVPNIAGPTILPKTAKTSALKETVGFVLSKHPKGVLLYFYSKDPNLYLDKTHPFVVSFTSHFPLELTPSTITGMAWPKNSDKVVVSVRSQNPKIHGGLITAKAAFTYCHRIKKNCWQGHNALEFLYDG